MKKTKDRKFYILTTTALCPDAVVGQLLDKFVDKTATPEEAARFLRHCKACLRCSFQVSNERIMNEASEHYGLPRGPELNNKLIEVWLNGGRGNRKKVAQEMAARIASWRVDPT